MMQHATQIILYLYLHVARGLTATRFDLADRLLVRLVVDVDAHNVAAQRRILQGQLLADAVARARDQDDLVLDGDRLAAPYEDVQALDQVVHELDVHNDDVHNQLENV